MSGKSTRFASEQAPCGQTVDGERYQDHVGRGLVSDEHFYDCGCRSTREEFHDGCISRKVVHHNGTVLVDELVGGQ